MTPPKPKLLREYLSAGGGGPISIQGLSEILAVTPEQLRPLVDHKYLRVIFNKEPFPLTVVAAPAKENMLWLQQMFAPFHLRPMIKLVEVRWMIDHYKKKDRTPRWHPKDAKLDEYREICARFKIPIYIDPVFGELLTIDGLGKLHYHLGVYKHTVKKDRAGILAYLLNTLPFGDKVKGKATLKPPRYSKHLSLEINRIAQLPAQQRTIMAMHLYEAWRDARKLQECLAELKSMRKYLEKNPGQTSFAYKVGPAVAEVFALDDKMERMKEQVTTV